MSFPCIQLSAPPALHVMLYIFYRTRDICYEQGCYTHHTSRMATSIVFRRCQFSVGYNQLLSFLGLFHSWLYLIRVPLYMSTRIKWQHHHVHRLWTLLCLVLHGPARRLSCTWTAFACCTCQVRSPDLDPVMLWLLMHHRPNLPWHFVCSAGMRPDRLCCVTAP